MNPTVVPNQLQWTISSSFKEKLYKEREDGTDDSLETTNVISDEDRQDVLSLHHEALKIRSKIKSIAPFNN